LQPVKENIVKFRAVAAALTLLVPASIGTASSAAAASTVVRPAQTTSSAPLFGDLPASIQQSKVINVATSTAYPPYDYTTANSSTVIGFEVDLRAAIAKLLGVTFVTHVTGFDELIVGIESGRFQAAMDGIGDTAAREKVVSFVDYGQGGDDTILVLTSNAKQVTNLLSLCGKTVGGGVGSGAIERAQAIEKICTTGGEKPDVPVTFPSAPEVLLAVESGRIYSQMEDSVTGPYDAHASKGEITAISISGKYATGSFAPGGVEGIAVAKGQTQLAKALQLAFNDIISNGTYAKILQKWGIPTFAVKHATINDPNA
jgi:polar amino acid transport system substrate-binding protein